MGVEGTLDQLEDHVSSLWKLHCNAKNPRKPRKCCEIAFKESRASKGGWRWTDRRGNLPFIDPDCSNTWGLSLRNILSGPLSLSALFSEPPSLLQHHFGYMAIQTLQEDMHVY